MFRHLLQKRCGIFWGLSLAKTPIRLQSAGAAFRSHLATCMKSMGYETSKAYPDLWLKLESIPEDEIQYYSYLLCNLDNKHLIDHNADGVLQHLHQSFPLKPGFDSPEMYLGTKLHMTRLYNRLWAWANSPLKNVHKAVRNWKAYLEAKYSDRFRLPKRADGL